MANEAWDDDDFGTFESADASSPVVAESAAVSISTTTPAWLLPVQQQKTSDQESFQVASSCEKSVAEGLSKVNEHQSQTPLKKIQETSIHEESSTSNILLSESWQDFASISGEVNSSPSLQNALPHSQAGDNFFSETDSKSAEKKTFQFKDEEVQVDNVSENEEILSLKGMLDNAVALQIHTEKSLQELQQEMEKVLTEAKSARELKEHEHAAEIERLKETQENDLNLLQEESQKTMNMLTEKYASFVQQASFERNGEHEKNIEDVVEKCLDILQTQSSVLSEKLALDAATQNQTVSELIESCRSDLKGFVKSECDAVAAKCDQVKRETGDYLKAEIAKEFECQRQIDEKCKREAMEKLSRSLKAQLEETLKQEREKSSNAIESAVQEARKSLRKEMEEDQKKSNQIRDQHAMALQMLLSASQEHLRCLTKSYSGNCEESG